MMVLGCQVCVCIYHGKDVLGAGAAKIPAKTEQSITLTRAILGNMMAIEIVDVQFSD